MNSVADRIRVILIEDQKAVRELTRRYLDGYADIEVIADVEKAEDGLPLVTEHAPDVVLLDLHLNTSRVTGRDALTAITKRSPVTRVVVFSGFPDEVMEAKARGCSGFILKSDNSEEIVEAIRDVARGELHFSEMATLRVIESQGQQKKGDYAGVSVRFTDLLSEREVEILDCLKQGKSNKEIGELLSISWRTVKRHVSNILMKSGSSSRTEIVGRSIQ